MKLCLYGCGSETKGTQAVCRDCRAVEMAGDKKMCRSCTVIKSRDDFTGSKQNADGLHTYCRECSGAKAAESVRRVQIAVAAISRRAAGIDEPETGRCRAFVNMGVSYIGSVRCGRPSTGGGYCTSHAPREVREIARRLAGYNKGTVSFGAGFWRAKQAAREEADLRERCEEYPELVALLAEQEKDARYNQLGRKWMVSLDAVVGDSGRASNVDFVTEDGGFVLWGNAPRNEAPWVEPLIAAMDRRREIDAWADEWEAQAA